MHIEFEFVGQENSHGCVVVSVARLIPEKGARYAYLIQIDDAQNVSRMCVCVLSS